MESSPLPDSKLYAILDELGLGFICQFESFSDQQSNQEPEFETLRGWENTKWIALSSSFFSIPALRVFYLSGTLAEPANRHANYMAYLCIVTSLVSANYWRDAKRGWRRNADLILAKITFATGVYFGFIYLPEFPYSIPFYSSIALAMYLYNQSTICLSNCDSDWVKYHFAFHICLAICVSSIMEPLHFTKNMKMQNDYCDEQI
jgi:hypothetical protein